MQRLADDIMGVLHTLPFYNYLNRLLGNPINPPQQQQQQQQQQESALVDDQPAERFCHSQIVVHRGRLEVAT